MKANKKALRRQLKGAKSALRKCLAELTEARDEQQKTAREAHYAEAVCFRYGQTIDPANKYVLRHRQERLQAAYEDWREKVPDVPWRGFFWPTKRDTGWSHVEWLDQAGYWRELNAEAGGLKDEVDSIDKGA
jgi:hypothetical protein